MVSCSDYLNEDRYFKDRQSLEHIFESKDYTEQWLANCYSFLNNSNTEISSTDYSITNYADDVIFNEKSSNEQYRKYKFGEYNYSWYNDSWDDCYKGIRQSSIFIQNIDRNPMFTPSELKDLKAQARYLRAYYYWLLLRKYGPVVIEPEEGSDYEADYDDLSLPRSSYDECVEYICKEMLLAAQDLPLKRDNINKVRPTRGAALSVRAKVLLFAASPEMNGNTEMSDFVDDKGRILISQEYDESKWAKAAAACKDVIDLNVYSLYVASRRSMGNESFPATIEPPYNAKYSNENWPKGWADIDPYLSYRALFDGEISLAENPEIIFSRGQNQTAELKKMVLHHLPISGGGYNCHGLTQKQCDAYAMNDGTPFDRATCPKGQYTTSEDVAAGKYLPLKADVNLEYANREPRFYASVAFNGTFWPFGSADPAMQNVQIWYYRTSPDGRSNTERWIPTGIGIMKYVHPEDYNITAQHNRIVPKYDPAIRYADILLMYAETLNELNGTYEIPAWDNSRTYSVSRNVDEMSSAISLIRIRGGVPDYDASVYADQSALRKQIKRERMVELLAENQRYYDLRRWKDAPVEEAAVIEGCNVYITPAQRDLFYVPVSVPNLQTTFSKKQYFWPIRYNELKRNERMTQAPGWKDYD